MRIYLLIAISEFALNDYYLRYLYQYISNSGVFSSEYDSRLADSQNDLTRFLIGLRSQLGSQSDRISRYIKIYLLGIASSFQSF
jgi:hypothetical protein